ncbi:hypothetical protein AgCh_006287 [Apium graveolens]
MPGAETPELEEGTNNPKGTARRKLNLQGDKINGKSTGKNDIAVKLPEQPSQGMNKSTNEKPVIKFSKRGQPIGERKIISELSNFPGTLVKDHVSITHVNWHVVPQELKKNIVMDQKLRFQGFLQSPSMADKNSERAAKIASASKRGNDIEIRSSYMSLLDMINTRGDEYPSNAHFDSFNHYNTWHNIDYDKLNIRYNVRPPLRLVSVDGGDSTFHWKPDTLFVYTDALNVGLRFPFHPFIPHLLADLKISPCQLPPNASRNILCFMKPDTQYHSISFFIQRLVLNNSNDPHRKKENRRDEKNREAAAGNKDGRERGGGNRID